MPAPYDAAMTAAQERHGGTMKVTFRQLQVFDAVATLGSITRAADALNMSQSATSSALNDLQIILRRPLFAHSKGRPLSITDEGKRLHPIARSLLGQIRDFEHEENAPLSGRLVIGATSLIAETLLPRLCVEFMQRYPEVQISIQTDTTRNLIERMTRFEIETALIEILPDITGIELTKWRTDELILVVAKGHPLADRGQLTVADLAGYPWCTRESEASITARTRYLLHDKIGLVPVAFDATSNWAVRHAVIAGGGIGCLSRVLVQFDIDGGRLRELDVVDFKFSRPLNLARPSHIWRSPLSTAFDQFLLDNGDA